MTAELRPAPAEVKRYRRRKIIAGLAELVAEIAVIATWAFLLAPAIRPWLREWSGANVWWELSVVALGLAASVGIVGLPFDFYAEFILEHQFGLSRQTLRQWCIKRIKSWLVGGIVGAILVAGLYALLWWSGRWWWIWATVGWLLFTLVLGRIAPIVILPLFYRVTPLADEELTGRLRQLAAGTGLRIEGVYRLALSAETKKANAALTGLGRSRRVLIGDTLLEQFTPEEIEVVFAHEVGHHVHRHLPKMIAWSTATTLIGFAAADLAIRHLAGYLDYDSVGDPLALPLLLLVLTCVGLVLTPLQNMVSRIFETQCDRYALERTGNAEAYRSAFIKLAEINKADPDPHPVVVFLFYDHPPIRQRLRLAETKQDVVQ